MNFYLRYYVFAILLSSNVACVTQDKNADLFVHPERGFTSIEPAKNWQHGLLTGNETTGAFIRGEPYNETITVSHKHL